ncbi:MAG: hypothetical protein F4Y04_05590 [Chloroflexi bacterium]|nr:hypothetical protein [Chloroflexota bacterium]
MSALHAEASNCDIAAAVRGIRQRANCEGWLYRKIEIRGQRAHAPRIFDVYALPADVRERLAAHKDPAARLGDGAFADSGDELQVREPGEVMDANQAAIAWARGGGVTGPRPYICAVAARGATVRGALALLVACGRPRSPSLSPGRPDR